MKILAVCDTPTVQSGFGRVASNLCHQWHLLGHSVDVWGINFNGYPHDLPFKIYPASWSENYSDFRDPRHLKRLLERIQIGQYDVVWVMQDALVFAVDGFPEAFKKAVADAGSTSVLYLPVDAPLSPDWDGFARCVDTLVAYCQYGRQQMREAWSWLAGVEVLTIPHGVDTQVYQPMPDREGVRFGLLPKVNGKLWAAPDELLMLNVNANQKRKDPARSLALLARMVMVGIPAKLLMHMPARTPSGVDLEVVGEQLGLRYGEHWVHTGSNFTLNHSRVTEAGLNRLYNAADVVLSTTYGEGWGLAQVEAAATGAMVVSPRNTACIDIFQALHDHRAPCRLLPLAADPVVLPYDNDRVRYGVSVEASMSVMRGVALEFERETNRSGPRRGLPQGLRDLWCWKRIAKEWVGLFERKGAGNRGKGLTAEGAEGAEKARGSQE